MTTMMTMMTMMVTVTQIPITTDKSLLDACSLAGCSDTGESVVSKDGLEVLVGFSDFGSWVVFEIHFPLVFRLPQS